MHQLPTILHLIYHCSFYHGDIVRCFQRNNFSAWSRFLYLRLFFTRSSFQIWWRLVLHFPNLRQLVFYLFSRVNFSQLLSTTYISMVWFYLHSHLSQDLLFLVLYFILWLDPHFLLLVLFYLLVLVWAWFIFSILPFLFW